MAIDTLKVAKRLREAGFTEPQAEAVTAAVQEATEEAEFATKPDIIDANLTALKAGWNYGETTDAFASSYKVDKAKLPPGTYRARLRVDGVDSPMIDRKATPPIYIAPQLTVQP